MLRVLVTLLGLAPLYPAQLADPLENLRPEHPRLILLDTQLPSLRSLIRQDPQARHIYQQLLEEARKLQALPPVRFQLVNGRMLGTSRLCVDRIYTLALLYRLDSNPEYLERALAELRAVSGFPTWNDNFLDKAEMTHAVAIGYDWLYNSLTPEDRALLRNSILSKGIRDALPVYQEERWWAVNRFNWNLVCNASVGLGALAVAEDEPALARTLLRYGLQSLPLAMASYAPDGAWAEGPEYWHYATRYAVYFLAGLRTALGQDFGLSAMEGFSNTGGFRVHSTGPSGKSLSFADASETPESAPEMFWLARRFRQPVYAWHQRRQLELSNSPHALDLVWYHPEQTTPQQAHWLLNVYFRDAELAMLRTSWDDPTALFVGVKAGGNRGGRGHAHLDLGSFVLDAGQTRWALDLGRDDYDLPNYFGALRWTYYRTKTESHNTVLIDGQDQDPAAEASIVAHRFQPDLAFVRIDLSGVYPGKLRRFHRGIALYKRQHVIIQDEITAPRPVEALWGMLTDAEVSVSGRTAELRKGNWILSARILAPAGATFDTVSTHAPPPQTPNPNTRKLVVRLPDKITNLRLIVSLTPHPNTQPPPPPSWRPRSLNHW